MMFGLRDLGCLPWVAAKLVKGAGNDKAEAPIMSDINGKIVFIILTFSSLISSKAKVKRQKVKGKKRARRSVYAWREFPTIELIGLVKNYSLAAYKRFPSPDRRLLNP